jgi:ribosomal protein S1
MGKITSKCKGGCIVEHIDTGSLMFLPGSQISDKPLKDISHLMNEPQKFALIKLDKVRGNACVSRREIISSFKKRIKQKLLKNTMLETLSKEQKLKVIVHLDVSLMLTENLMFWYIYKKFHIQELIILKKFLILEKNTI